MAFELQAVACCSVHVGPCGATPPPPPHCCMKLARLGLVCMHSCLLQEPSRALELLAKVVEVDPRDYDAFIRQADIYMVRVQASSCNGAWLLLSSKPMLALSSSSAVFVVAMGLGVARRCAPRPRWSRRARRFSGPPRHCWPTADPFPTSCGTTGVWWSTGKRLLSGW